MPGIALLMCKLVVTARFSVYLALYLPRVTLFDIVPSSVRTVWSCQWPVYNNVYRHVNRYVHADMGMGMQTAQSAQSKVADTFHMDVCIVHADMTPDM